MAPSPDPSLNPETVNPLAVTQFKTSTEHLRYLVDAVGTIEDYAIFMLDPYGNILTWNKGAERIKGYSFPEVVGKHFSMFWTPEDRKAMIPNYALTQAREKGKWKGEGWRVRKDGTRFWASLVITAVYDREGRFSGFAKITRDLTEKKLYEENLERVNIDLEQRVEERTRELEEANIGLQKKTDELLAVNRHLEQFSYIASHDLQEPVRRILIFSEMLQTETDMERRQSHILRVRKAALHVKTLIDSLLEFMRTGKDKEQTDADLRKILGEVIDELDAPPDTEITIAHLPVIRADAILMKQLFQNLIVNSLKYKKPNAPARIEVSSHLKGQELHIVFHDYGVGFDMKFADKLFRPFQRLHGREEYQGTGIGLAICQRIVQKHGGTISASGEVGKGAVFTIRLPKQN